MKACDVKYFSALNKAINAKVRCSYFYELVKRYSYMNNIPIKKAYWILAESI